MVHIFPAGNEIIHSFFPFVSNYQREYSPGFIIMGTKEAATPLHSSIQSPLWLE